MKSKARGARKFLGLFFASEASPLTRKLCERSEHATENPKSARRNDTSASKKCSKILHFHEKKKHCLERILLYTMEYNRAEGAISSDGALPKLFS